VFDNAPTAADFGVYADLSWRIPSQSNSFTVFSEITAQPSGQRSGFPLPDGPSQFAPLPACSIRVASR